jgi:ComF family protein
VASAYQGISTQLISRLKFSRTQAAASIIAKIIDSRLPSLSADTIVVHVPTANQRVRQRGYDQAQLIARELARYRGLPYQALLRRHGKTRQVGANRQERLVQLQKAYHCPYPARVERRKILLVDDVLTTGATIETASKVLKLHGASEVRAALFSQKV